MINPIRLFTGTEKEFVMIQGYVRSVTDRGSYNSVSFLADSNNRGAKAPLVSVMCFDNTTGINYKKTDPIYQGQIRHILCRGSIQRGRPPELQGIRHLYRSDRVQRRYQPYQ